MTINCRTLAWLCAIAIGTMPLAHAGECNGLNSAAKSFLDAQQQLQRVSRPSPNNDQGDTKVEPAVADGIFRLKQTLTDAVDALMACAPASADTNALSRTLASAINNKGANRKREPGDSTFGDILGIDITRDPVAASSTPTSAQAPISTPAPATTAAIPMFVVRIGVGIACGDDNILLGYAWQKGHWVRTVRWQSDKYTSIDGAFGGYFQYLRLPDGRLVVLHGTPWCSSRFSAFSFDVVAPAAQGQAANEMTRAGGLHFHHGYLLDDEDVLLKPTANGFEIRAQVTSLDTDLMQRLGIFRFRVDNAGITRIQPVANNGRDFVDEWLQVDEAQAKSLTAPASADAAIAERNRLLATARKQSLGLSYGAVRACSSPGLFQSEVQLNTDAPDKASLHYAQLRQAANGFTLISFATSPDAQCRGPDLMARKRH